MDDEPLHAHPVFEFNRPHLYLGGDRELVLLSLLLSIVLIVILQNLYTAILGIAVAFSSVYGLRILCKSRSTNARRIFTVSTIPILLSRPQHEK